MGEIREAEERMGCWCRKKDFLPEKSFESWGSYGRALKATPSRFADRLTARSMEQVELNEVKARSHHEMKKTLTWWDLMCFGIGSVVGAGIFVLTGQEARRDAGPAVVLSYVISGVSAMLSVFCYTEFAVEIPVAGGSFAYLRVELGDFVAFITAGNILLESVIGTAAVARAFTSNLATLVNRSPDSLLIHVPALGDDYGHLDLVAVALIAIVCVIAVMSIKGSSRLNYVVTVLHIAVIVFIIVAGLTKADPANYSPFFPYKPHGIFKASAVLFFSYLGFDAVATMAEETKNPGRDIPIGLVGSMSITTIIYCLMSITLCLMQPYTAIDESAAFPIAFEKVGLGWAKNIVALGAVMGMVTVLVVGAVGQARYLTHIARTHMMPPWLAHVNSHTGTPLNATIVTAIGSAIVALFTDLSVLSNLLSISTLFIFMMVAVALLVRRYYSSGHTSVSDRNKLVFFILLILSSSIATATYWGLTDSHWAGYCITVPIWILATLGLSVLVPQAKKPRVWGVPLVPWLPSGSIFINVFLLGSIDKMSFVRFGVWTALLLVYYVFLGLHASYDTAMGDAEIRAINYKTPTLGKVEEGEANVANSNLNDV